jgi:hypothetical protein
MEFLDFQMFIFVTMKSVGTNLVRNDDNKNTKLLRLYQKIMATSLARNQWIHFSTF